MLKSFTTIFGLAAVLLVTASVALAADARARAEVPFAFEANGRSFQPGTYYFESGVWHGVLAISDANGNKFLMAVVPMGNPNKPVTPQLRFVRTSAKCALSEVWMSSGAGGHKFTAPAPGTRVEIALVRP
jgi:hypothetical protein